MSDSTVELLAPAGNWECARAAVANGADAIYFGMPKFNARIRADNFTPTDLPELMDFLHDHGVRGFVAFNTLIFPSELDAAASQLHQLSKAGVDAIIVQDLGLATMARAMVPDLHIHASTQMTITSPEALAFANELFNLERAVIARENSLKEIHLFQPREPGAVELETFVHGALCVAYSGQCLTSESLGQRSANRGECAQACRMPYELVVDGETKDLGDRRYLLSPQDLAGIEQIPQLIELGVKSFKIEGRLKTPEYVAAVTRAYRKAIDDHDAVTSTDRYHLEMAFSRGLSSGWLEGIDNQKLVHARFGKKRGAYIGRVTQVGAKWVEVDGEASLKKGDGLVFDQGENTDREQGGRVYTMEGRRLTFQHDRIKFEKIEVGARVWKTDDPALNSELKSTFQREHLPSRKTALHWKVRAAVGERLILTDEKNEVEVVSSKDLEAAEKRPVSQEYLEKQLSRLGNTTYELASLEVEIEGEPMCPASELNRMRRTIVEQLDRAREEPFAERRTTGKTVTDLLPERFDAEKVESAMTVLCRTEEQVDAAIESGIARVYIDLEDVRRYRAVVASVREQSPEMEVFLATPRIQKAGESGLFRIVERARPDGVLVRNLGGIEYFKKQDHLKLVGDFSLNIANPISASRLIEQGLEYLTVSYDLNIEQVLDLLKAAPPEWFELTLHQHMPMFHMEHCVFCTFLSEGTNVTNCGRPCDKYDVQLRDRVGQLHPLSADVGCRNTLYNGRAQSGASFFPTLRAAGLSKYRVEMLREDRVGALSLIASYRDILTGLSGSEELPYVSRLGVVEGTLAV